MVGPPRSVPLLRLLLATTLLLVLLQSAPYAFILSQQKYSGYRVARIIVPAVEETPRGLVGVTSNLTVIVAWPGRGDIYISTSPLAGLDTQASARLAVLVASIYAGVDYRKYDYFIKYEAFSPRISGPSASAALALAVFASLRGYTLPSDFSMTGMIGPDGSVNPVGGVVEKLKAVASKGVKIFIVPAGERIVVDENTGRRVDVVELGRKLGVRVEVAYTLLDVIRALGLKYSKVVEKRINYPDWIKTSLVSFIEDFRREAVQNATIAERLLKNITQQELRSVISDYLNKAKKLLNESRVFQEEKFLYSAASRAFMAAWYSTTASYLAKIGVSPNPMQMLEKYSEELIKASEEILKKANTTYTEFAQRGEIGLSSLQLAITLYDRVKLARDAIIEAKTTSDPIGLIFSSTYAYYRAVTAIQWASLLSASLARDQLKVRKEAFKQAVDSYIYYAEATLTYLQSLGIPVGLEQVDRARKLVEKDPIAAASTAVSALSDGIASLHLAFRSGVDRLSASSNTTHLLLSLALEKGIPLLLPLFYAEYADNIAASSLSREAISQAVGLYASAASYTLLVYMASPASHQTPTTSTETTTPLPAKTTTIVKTSIITVKLNNTVTVSKQVYTTIEKTYTTTLTKTVRTPLSEAKETNWLYPLVALLIVLIIFVLLCRKMGSQK